VATRARATETSSWSARIFDVTVAIWSVRIASLRLAAAILSRTFDSCASIARLRSSMLSAVAVAVTIRAESRTMRSRRAIPAGSFVERPVVPAA
jgi:hypothetical protein